ncbi:MAG: PTS system nitrogen regulatory IIA component [Gammaproteobacteria bacterium]|jgi:PTS system nitrogen regulatory IIA component
MNLSTIIQAKRVVTRDASSKKRAIEIVAGVLSDSPEQTDIAFGSLLGRERLGSTGLGNGVAIPHGRIKGIDNPIGAFMRVPDGVDFEASDGQPVDLIFALLVPADCTEEHLQILAAVAGKFSDDNFTNSVRAAADDAAVHRLITA